MGITGGGRRILAWEKGVSDAFWQSRSSVVGHAAGKSEAYRPRAEGLEERALMAQLLLGQGTPFDLASQQTTPPNGPQTLGGQLPFIADSFFNPTTGQSQGNQTTDPGLGILETGNVPNQGVGFNVAAVTDMNFDGSNDFVIGAPTVTRNGSVISPATGITDTAYLVSANRSANAPTTQSWLSATPEQRVGIISTLGGNIQANPFTNRAVALQLYFRRSILHYQFVP